MTHRILAAQMFVHKAHNSINQKRKYSGEPYWVHTDEVADTVASVTNDEDTIVGAHGHDLKEDVFPELLKQLRIEEHDVLFAEYMTIFYGRADLFVNELTDVYTREAFSNKNRAERKRLERERIGKISIEAKTIKLADLISNTKSIVTEDAGFAKTYLKEKFALLGELSNGNPILLQRATAQTLESFQKLGLTIPFIAGSLHT